MVLKAAFESVRDITRFELIEPPMREIFVTAVTEQQSKLEDEEESQQE